MVAAGLVAFVLGILLAKFNVFSVAIATMTSAVAVFIIAALSGWTVLDSILVSILAILALQAGYVGGHLFRTLQK
ncbi:hypothetical protein [Bradyrhizobium jicamae]|uniref:hypothetical protein n=1 Tax=Bradyrhizobium jicamae TaxID=280332 RepID=UPI000AD67AF3|nr:hypothetical protein [Bradyrhizobium jicamae]